MIRAGVIHGSGLSLRSARTDTSATKAATARQAGNTNRTSLSSPPGATNRAPSPLSKPAEISPQPISVADRPCARLPYNRLQFGFVLSRARYLLLFCSYGGRVLAPFWAGRRTPNSLDF